MINYEEGADIFAEGVLEILPDGYGFLRSPDYNYLPGPDDIHVSPSKIRKFDLRTGDTISGQVRPPHEGEKYFALVKIEAVNFESPEEARNKILFDNLAPVYPQERLKLETTRENLVPRFLDLMAPLGKGQCGLIVGPRHTGKRLILESIAKSLAINHPEVTVLVLLIDEHQSEAAATQRSLKVEVTFTTWDESNARHIQVTELVAEKAKRFAEKRRDVVLLIDSLNHLASAYRAVFSGSGELLGQDLNARLLRHVKRLLESPRNLNAGGSLTMLAIVENEVSQRDDHNVLEDCKSVADLLIVLDHRVARQGIFPAIDVHRTRNGREELLTSEEELTRLRVLRRVLEPLAAAEAAKLLGGKLIASRSNKEFLANMSSL